MNNKQHDNLAGALVLLSGLVIGAASALFYKENKPKNAGQVLKQVKESFSKQGEIEGSWIDYDPVEYEIYESLPLVYVGGITRRENSELISYHFICDAFTGDILDIYEIQSD